MEANICAGIGALGALQVPSQFGGASNAMSPAPMAHEFEKCAVTPFGKTHSAGPHSQASH
jgi:hypothetical protein